MANIPERGIVMLTGWITYADAQGITLLDENNNHTQLNREQLIGSIVVLEEQREIPEKMAQNNIKRELCQEVLTRHC